MVSMVAFQAVDPGSIPGHRILFFNIKRILLTFYLFKNYNQPIFLQMKIFPTIFYIYITAEMLLEST